MITVGGLGPAGDDLMTVATREAIGRALEDAHSKVRLRTAVHPAAAAVDAPSYDDIYDVADSFEAVYEAIVDDLLDLAKDGDVLYLVPGSPIVAEHTVELLLERAPEMVELLPAMSFLDLAWSRLGIDPVAEQVRLVDGHRFEPHGDTTMLVSQCHDRSVLSDIKLAYDDREPRTATILHHLGLDDEVVGEVPWAELDRTLEPDHLTSVLIPATPMPSMASMLRLDLLVQRLRTDCPWDSSQDHVSLTPHLLEEAYEVVEVLDDAQRLGGARHVDDVRLCEELGDLLFQVVLHATIAAEDDRFDLASVADGIHDKLYARHPHVFGDVEIADNDELAVAWEAIKAEEKGLARVLDGLPRLPSLALASKVVRKVRRAGFAYDDPSGAWAKVREELDEFAEADDDDEREREFGDVLLAVVGLAWEYDLDPDAALRHTIARFRERFDALEDVVSADGRSVGDLSSDELISIWSALPHD